jgi:hypothetical protein
MPVVLEITQLKTAAKFEDIIYTLYFFYFAVTRPIKLLNKKKNFSLYSLNTIRNSYLKNVP